MQTNPDVSLKTTVETRIFSILETIAVHERMLAFLSGITLKCIRYCSSNIAELIYAFYMYSIVLPSSGY